MKFEQVNDEWQGMDPDDVPGYLTDYLCGEFSFEDGDIMSDQDIANVIKEEPQKVYEVLVNIKNAIKADKGGE